MLDTVVKYGGAALAVSVAFLVYQFNEYSKTLPVTYQVNDHGIVLVTGASTGIGYHAVLHLATRYPKMIVLAGVRKEKDADAVRALNMTNLQPIMVDVGSESSCKSAFGIVQAIVKAESLPFIALVNNAGVARRYPAELHDIVDAKQIFNTNFWGAFYLTQLFLPLLRQSRGRIINISSIAEFTGTPMNSVYVASKTAMGGWSDALRREVAHFGISVSIVQPAYIRSAIFTSAKEAISRQSEQQSLLLLTHYKHYFNSEALANLDAEIRADASEPDVVSEAIDHALCNAHPKTRYAVGKVAGVSATMCAWVRWVLTDRGADRLMTPVL